jgi:hypothetical protein
MTEGGTVPLVVRRPAITALETPAITRSAAAAAGANSADQSRRYG